MKNSSKLFVSVIGCELVGILGLPVNLYNIPNWYVTLNKPFFTPPDWIFGPVWAMLYILMGLSVYLIWIKNTKKTTGHTALKFFLIQLFLNGIWSPIFFGLRSPILGLITIVAMWLMIVWTMKKFYSLSKPAFYLLIPYLAWVSFATLLNASIVYLN